jgi:hypothetical protein
MSVQLRNVRDRRADGDREDRVVINIHCVVGRER